MLCLKQLQIGINNLTLKTLRLKLFLYSTNFSIIPQIAASCFLIVLLTILSFFYLMPNDYWCFQNIPLL